MKQEDLEKIKKNLEISRFFLERAKAEKDELSIAFYKGLISGYEISLFYIGEI